MTKGAYQMMVETFVSRGGGMVPWGVDEMKARRDRLAALVKEELTLARISGDKKAARYWARELAWLQGINLDLLSK